MHIYLYDGTFEGMLTAIFYSFADKDELDIQRAAHAAQRACRYHH